MTIEVLVIALVRILGSLPALRWPLAGGLLAVVIDVSDLFMRDLLDLGGVPDYQSLDKWLDQVYMACFLIVALRWQGAERAIAAALYAYRLVGFAAFELIGDRTLLFLFPNVFELWFLLVAAVHHFRPGLRWSRVGLAVALIVLTAIKVLQEWALHVGQVFEGFSSLDAVGRLWAWLTGGR
jgi:hypothetical protein